MDKDTFNSYEGFFVPLSLVTKALLQELPSRHEMIHHNS